MKVTPITPQHDCRCGGTFEVSKIKGKMAIVHSFPSCKQLDLYEGPQYLAWVRTGDPNAPEPKRGAKPYKHPA